MCGWTKDDRWQDITIAHHLPSGHLLIIAYQPVKFEEFLRYLAYKVKMRKFSKSDNLRQIIWIIFFFQKVNNVIYLLSPFSLSRQKLRLFLSHLAYKV